MPFGNRPQTATLWARSAVNAAGDPSWGDPASIAVRWEKRSAVVQNAKGEEKKGSSIVWVGTEVSEGDMLLLGTSAVADPNTVTGAKRVLGFEETPSVDGTLMERQAVVG